MKITDNLRPALLALALGTLLAGPLQGAGNDPAGEFAQAVEKAEAARQKAASVGGEWRDTGKLIKKAKAAAKKGDHPGAMRLANTAYRQGELGYQQAMGQKNAGFPAYMQKH